MAVIRAGQGVQKGATMVRASVSAMTMADGPAECGGRATNIRWSGRQKIRRMDVGHERRPT